MHVAVGSFFVYLTSYTARTNQLQYMHDILFPTSTQVSLHERLQCTSVYTPCSLVVPKQFPSLGNELSVVYLVTVTNKIVFCTLTHSMTLYIIIIIIHAIYTRVTFILFFYACQSCSKGSRGVFELLVHRFPFWWDFC